MSDWREHELAAVDVETTGLSARGGDRIIEVAVVRGRAGMRPHRWSTLVNPGRPVAATHIHGITDTDLAPAPPFAAIAATLAGHLRGATVVAHNASFDLGFIDMEFERAAGTRPVTPVLDTLGLARRHLALSSNSLGALCTWFDIPRGVAHRALADADATWHLAWHLLSIAAADDAPPPVDSIPHPRGRSPAERDEVRAALITAWRHQRPVWISYRSADSPDKPRTRREISVRHVNARRVIAWCHLREAERTFRLDRLTLLAPPDSPPSLPR